METATMPTPQLYGAQAAQQKALVGGMQPQGQSLSPETKAKMRAQAQDFESFYIYQFLELVTPENKQTVLNGGPGEEMFHHQLNEEMGKTIAQRGGFGVADTVYAELVRQQEAHNAAMARAGIKAKQYQ